MLLERNEKLTVCKSKSSRLSGKNLQHDFHVAELSAQMDIIQIIYPK